MKIDKLLKMDMKSLNNYILEKCSRNEKIEILKNIKIREKYLNIGSYDYVLFAFLLIGLKYDAKYMIDDEFIDLIFKDNFFVEDRLRLLIACCPDVVNKYSHDIRIIEAIVNSQQLIRHVDKLGSKFGKFFLEYIVNHDMINKFLNLSDKVQADLLKDKENLELLKKVNISDLFISSLNSVSIQNMMKDLYFANRVVNMGIEVVDSIVKKGVTIPIDDIIIDKYVNVDNINLYRAYIENLDKCNSNLVDIIESKRNKMYDMMFDNISSNGLLSEYQNIYISIINGEEVDAKYAYLVMGFYGSSENIFKFLYAESNDRLHDILIDRYFKDIPYNFLMNLEMMLNFVSSINVELIDVDNLKLYKQIYGFKELSVRDKINLYKYLNNGKNYMQIFYDDYRKCKNYAYSLYNDKVLKTEKMNKSDLSLKYGVDVYELDGQDFTAFVHQTKYDRDNDAFDGIWESNDNFKEGVSISLSMIDQNHIDTIYGMDLFVCFGFSNLDIDRIMHVYHMDSYTKNFKSAKVNEILTVDNLMSKTKDYNEIFYLENSLSMKYGNKKYEKLMPSYVLCHNKITELEVSIAKEFKIPIVLLHGDKYVNKYADYNEDEIYLTGYEKKWIKR